MLQKIKPGIQTW